MQDSALARARPSSIAHAVYEAIKVTVTILWIFNVSTVNYDHCRVWTWRRSRSWRAAARGASLTTRTCGASSCSPCASSAPRSCCCRQGRAACNLGSGSISLRCSYQDNVGIGILLVAKSTVKAVFLFEDLHMIIGQMWSSSVHVHLISRSIFIYRLYCLILLYKLNVILVL